MVDALSSEELFCYFKTSKWDDYNTTHDHSLVWLALLGLRVEAIRISPGEDQMALLIDSTDAQVVANNLTGAGDNAGAALVYAINEGRVWYLLTTDADCCSESWVADLVGVDTLLGERVVRAASVELPEHLVSEVDKDGKERTRQEFDRVYGWEIATRRGVCTIAMRNSSNGYYGGSMDFGGFVSAEHVSGWRAITEDFSA